jgi:anti-anti-sigma factor
MRASPSSGTALGGAATREVRELDNGSRARAVFSRAGSAGGTPIAVLHLSTERATLASLGAATCEVEPHRDAAHVVPSGELDIAAVPMVDARLRELHDAGFRRLVLDLRQVTFLDVCGLRLVLKWADGHADGGAAFHVIPGSPAVQRVFALTATTDQVSFLATGDAHATHVPPPAA